jgi:uncharacterized protein (TIGR02466 family)
MFLNPRVMQLFATPVYTGILTSLTEDLKEIIKSQHYEPLYSGKGEYTVNQRILDLPELKLVKEEVDDHIETYARDVLKVDKAQQFYLTTSWALRQNQGDFANSHSHTNSVISGVFYLNQGDGFGRLVFDKPYDNVFTKTLDPSYTEFTPINSGKWAVEPMANLIVLFPSILKHGVDINKSQDTRYSLAFNYFMKGQFGHKESELTLS